jgi:formamidopyrimidine-DNA glycosylase
VELPELTILGQQMDRELTGKRVAAVEVANPKCLNVPLPQFARTVVGTTLRAVDRRGKWLFIHLDAPYVLLFNSGMGADVLYFRATDELPAKYQIKFTFADGTGFTVRVWWFCYLHLVPAAMLAQHRLTAKLGVDPLAEAFTLARFQQLLRPKRGRIKRFLLDQKNLAGIGNVYVQDILFGARVHPQRAIPSLRDDEIAAMYASMRAVLQASIDLRGLVYEKDFYGRPGGYGPAQFQVAYKPGQPCPVCRTPIQKVKTGATSSFICPRCQPLSP